MDKAVLLLARTKEFTVVLLNTLELLLYSPLSLKPSVYVFLIRSKIPLLPWLLIGLLKPD